MAAAAFIPALISAAGSIGGAVAGQQDAPKLKDKSLQASDPVLSALLLQALMGSGAILDPGMFAQASPIAQLSRNNPALRQLQTIVAQGAAEGLTASQIAERARGISTGAEIGPLGGTSKFDFSGKAALKGYGSLEELIQADLDYRAQASDFATKYGAVQGNVQQGRLDALSAIAGLQSGFVAPTADAIKAQQSEIEAALRAQIEREFGERSQQALYEAQSLGINPAGRLKYLDESQALANLSAGPDALSRTLQLLTGQQGLQSTALSSLQNSLTAPQQNLQNAFQANLANRSLAANQAISMAQLQSQTGASNAGLLSQGIQGAANSAALIPYLLDEQRRRDRIDAGIDESTGITRPVY